jgi:hypothetical protein
MSIIKRKAQPCERQMLCDCHAACQSARIPRRSSRSLSRPTLHREEKQREPSGWGAENNGEQTKGRKKEPTSTTTLLAIGIGECLADRPLISALRPPIAQLIRILILVVLCSARSNRVSMLLRMLCLPATPALLWPCESLPDSQCGKWSRKGLWRPSLALRESSSSATTDQTSDLIR